MNKTVNQSEFEASTNPVSEPAATTTKPEAKRAEKAADVPPKQQKSVIREYFESFVVTLIMAFFGMTFIVQAVTVPTGSMQNTINIGDHLLVNKFIFAPGPPLPFLPMREIRRGDIVVFKYPGNRVNPAEDFKYNPPIVPYQTNYVKRVIGLPGETVEFRNNQVFINGQLLPEYRVIGEEPVPDAALDVQEFESREENETYTVYYDPRTMELAKRGASVIEGRDFNFGVAGKPMQVPANNYFVMGDSRDNSADSRVWGFVERDLIVGRAMFVYWSCDRSKSDTFAGCLTNPRFDRIGKLIK